MAKEKTLIPFHVINYDCNRRVMEQYNVMPYFVREYEDIKKKTDRPVTFEECKKFIEDKSRYMYWSRCEYEILLVDWPCSSIHEKWDIHKQLMMNHDIVTRVFMKNVGLDYTEKK